MDPSYKFQLVRPRHTATVRIDSGSASALTDSVAQRIIVSGVACHIPLENLTMMGENTRAGGGFGVRWSN